MDDLDNDNFGFASSVDRSYFAYQIGVDGNKEIAPNIYCASAGRTMYLSRREKNRLKHSENGNTVQKVLFVGDSSLYVKTETVSKKSEVRHIKSTLEWGLPNVDVNVIALAGKGIGEVMQTILECGAKHSPREFISGSWAAK